MRNIIHTHETDKKIPLGLIVIENKAGYLWLYYWQGNWRMNATNQISKKNDWFHKVYLKAVMHQVKAMKAESLPSAEVKLS